MKKNYPKVWEDYPDIWPTKAKFFSWLRGNLRRALWEKYPVKMQFKNEACEKPPDGYTGRAKSGKQCALTKEWTGKSKLEVDHIKGNASLRDWQDLEDFIIHLLCGKDNMQLVSKEAHKVKSYAERMGISFEEALIEKQVIAKTKQDVSKQKKELLENGYTEEQTTNQQSRRECYRDYYRARV